MRQNGGFSSLDSTIIRNFLFLFFLALCTIMPYDAPSTLSQKLNRKWAWRAKIASKWRFFVPGLYIFWKFFIIFYHRALHHHVLRYTVHTVTKIKPEVGVHCHNSVKMAVFRPWTRHFFEIFYFFSYTFGPSCATIQRKRRHHN